LSFVLALLEITYGREDDDTCDVLDQGHSSNTGNVRNFLLCYSSDKSLKCQLVLFSTLSTKFVTLQSRMKTPEKELPRYEAIVLIFCYIYSILHPFPQFLGAWTVPLGGR